MMMKLKPLRISSVEIFFAKASISSSLPKSKEYLGNDDEIEAFAKNISTELIRKAGKEGSLDLLRMANKTAGFKDEMGYLLSPNLLGYLAMWGFDTKHPVIKKLLKKVYNYIQNS